MPLEEAQLAKNVCMCFWFVVWFSVGGSLLGVLCWRLSVGGSLLGVICWGVPVGGSLLGALCWGFSVWLGRF